MITHLTSNINLFLTLNSKNLLNLSSEETFEYLAAFVSNEYYKEMPHIHNDEVCLKDDLTPNSSYERNLVVFNIDGTSTITKVKIRVLYCESDNHHHAFLSPHIIIPYKVYSLPSILMVLKETLVDENGVCKTCDKFNISTSTYYEWKNCFYSAFLSYYYQLKRKIDSKSFVSFIKKLFSSDFIYTLMDIALDMHVYSLFILVEPPPSLG